MDFKQYEDKLNQCVEEVFESIIKENQNLAIRTRARAGAEISDILEELFVKEIETNKYSLLSDPIKSPPGATKNPFDAKCTFTYMGRSEIIWIDIKAFKISAIDSNPDIGTINKVQDFIKQGNFYIQYVLVYYDEDGEGLKFVQHNDRFVKVYLLKDVNDSVRLNPHNQLQVNMSENPQYRTRQEFIHLLKQKQIEGHRRRIESSTNILAKIDVTYEEIMRVNKMSERR